jgi:trimeric autotransporter adhesin
LNLLFGSGTATPAETGLRLTNKGVFSFAPGQTFPGTGTVTGVASGAGLTGGLITKTGTLSIAAGGVTNGMLQNSTVTVKAGTDLTGGGVVALGGSTTLNLDTTKVPQLATANTFAASQSVVGSIFPDVTGTNNSSSSPGVIFGGTGSGKSITSNRTNSFFNQFGLDFYTNFATRTSIYQDGTIGMGNLTEKFGGTQVFINPPAGDNGCGDGMVVWPGSGIVAVFEGDVAVFGNLSKTGGSFKIDHPLDPGNKYLYHSFVESPDMKNIYDGVVTLDATGEALVVLPDWFDALNRDFRYQLTSIGAPGPNLYISQEVSGNRFAIAGGQPGMKVSWQVTGTRQDAWANAHRIPVEEEKSAQERGQYIAPELFGQPAEKQITNAEHPEMLREHKAVLEQSRNAAQALQQYQQQGLHLSDWLVQPCNRPVLRILKPFLLPTRCPAKRLLGRGVLVECRVPLRLVLPEACAERSRSVVLSLLNDAKPAQSGIVYAVGRLGPWLTPNYQVTALDFYSNGTLYADVHPVGLWAGSLL